MRLKKYLSAFLAAAMILNTGFFDVMAASHDAGAGNTDQVVSAMETVYVDSYGASGERSVSFNDHWRFYLGELNGAQVPSYNDASWKSVNLPHDYSIDQGYSTAAPAEQESGYVLGGTGWYRKTFTLPSEAEGKVVSVDFDGVYMNATVYLNGRQLGTHPYGYTPFSFVLPADVLKTGGEENVLAVKVEHTQPSSRWYSGSGIYRDVKLTVTDSVHVSYFGTAVTTPDIEDGRGTVQVAASIANDGQEETSVSVLQKVYEKGVAEPVAVSERTAAQGIGAGAEAKIESTLTVPNPKLWSVDTPNLYMVRTEVYVGEELADTYDSEFGFRWVEFTLDNGFFLNGQNMKLKGVSMHHDQGGLGSEAWRRAVERQVEKLQQMGVNAIRVTHNPASQVLIDICNEKGMLLVEEAFDCWLSGKAGNKEDYGKWFDRSIEEGNQIVGAKANEKWAEFDLKAMIKRGKNAPSIIMWSLGNEVFQQLIDSSRWNEYPQVARQLIQWTAQEDATRYVTFGDNQFKGNETNNNSVPTQTAKVFANAEQYGVPGGLPGYNYGGAGQIQNGHNQGWLVYGSETASSINSRGVYDRKNNGGDGGKGDKRLTSYDKSRVGWGHLASEGLWITMNQAFNAGEFIWTGFDYIGEPTPDNWQGTGANGTWPNIAKNSYFGIIDTAGFPKDSFYLYQSQWNDKLHTLHVLPVWNEDEIVVDNSGKVEVVVYSDAPVIKLYLNGEEVGTATAARKETPTGGYQTYTIGTGCFDASKASGHTSIYATFQVPYAEGKLEAKAFETDGREITDTDGRSAVETTKKASKLTAEADRAQIAADGKDLSYITIDTVDEDGKFVNGAEPEISVSVEGDGKLLALDNGVQNDVTAHGESLRKAGKGKLLAIVQSSKKAGSFTVKAEANGYETASVKVTTTAENQDPSEKRVASYEISRHYYVKKGVTPNLPDSVKVKYTDGSSETKVVSWKSLPSDTDADYVAYGTIADTNVSVSVYISVIEGVAAILNYSAAIGKGSEFSLPASRPAVMEDGTIISAEFPVTWNRMADTSLTGTQEIKGTSNVFGDVIDVTASIRVTAGGYRDGDEALPNVPEMYINGVSSKERESVAGVLDKLKDDKASKEDIAWSGRGTLDFRLDTAIDLKDFTLYLKDTAPTSNTMKLYFSTNGGETWQEADCSISNQRSNGVTVRTFTPKETVSTTEYRVEFSKNTTLLELEMNTRIPTFYVGEEAALSSLKAGGHMADEATLKKGWFGIEETDMDAQDLEVSGKDNASVTILPKNQEGIVKILLESEDHNVRSTYEVCFGKSNLESDNDNPEDGSLDYPYEMMKLTAASWHGAEPPEKANDGNNSTIWHSRWGDTGSGDKNLTNLPEKRYLQMELASVQTINALRYLPRSSDKNGIVLKYQVKASKEPLSEEQWQSQEAVAEGSWNTEVKWKMVKFETPVEAKYIRLYGVETSDNGGNVANEFMSAAEVRVRNMKKELHRGNTTVSLANSSMDYTGSELQPEPTVFLGTGEDKITLQKGSDYEVSYRNNLEPGTATVVVKGIAGYIGVIEEEFTINPVEEKIEGYEEVCVTTEKGVYPELPGTVIANTNIGQKAMEVQWDRIAASRLNKLGKFTLYGTVIETKAQITADIEISDVTGIQQATLATVKGNAPVMPEKAVVYYSNGEVARRSVEWDLSKVSFDKAGVAKVTGKVGKSQAEASVRVEEAPENMSQTTPLGKNFALNEDGISKSKEWPRTFAYISSTSDLAHHATDGVKEFVSGSEKSIWSDWENGRYHTNAQAEVGADDHLPFVASAFGIEGSESSADQKKYMVNKVRIGFMEEDGDSDHKVCLPKSYRIEYYSGNQGVIPAGRLENAQASGCSNVKGWGADNPIKAHDGWTEVAYIGGQAPAVPSSNDFKYMVDVEFEPVETTAIRIVLQPENENWTGLEEFEVYYEPISRNTLVNVSAINVDGKNVLERADQNNQIEIDAAEGIITAAAGGNASVTVLEAVNGKAKVIFLPENGDESKKKEYTVLFKRASVEDAKLMVTAEDEMVEIDQGEAVQGETVTFRAKAGYELKEEPSIVKSSDRSATGVTPVRGEDGNYTFTMPNYPVTIIGEPIVRSYRITYQLNGGEVENRTAYTIETPDFTLNRPTKADCIFLGWTGNGVTEPTVDMTVRQGTTGDLTFTANWRESKGYIIKFDTDGAGEIEDQEVLAGSGVIEEPAPLKKHGYDFVGWFSDAEKTKKWNFAEDRADRDMTLYAKWQEGKITVRTDIVCYMGQAFEMPESLNITIAGENFDTDVAWKQAEVEAVQNATDVGAYKVTGTLSDPAGRTVEILVPVSPAGVVYFVDNGAAEFTDKGQIVADANKDVIKNKNKDGEVVPDGAYSEETGWGYTNPESEVEATANEGEIDAYTTIRNMTNPGGRGKTLSYQFDHLQAGEYRVAMGFYDPWSQYAADYRHAKITLTDSMETELASKADHHISGTKDMAVFEKVHLKKDGAVTFNITPINSQNENCDVMVSFIVIQRMGDLTEIPITEIMAEEDEVSIEEGKTYQINASVKPEGTTDDKKLSYRSLNESIATVDESGLVKGKAEGTAKIEISCIREDVEAKVVTVHVTKKAVSEIPITEIKVKEMEAAIEEGKSWQIEASVVPENTTDDKKLSYRSLNESIATVDESGLVKGKAEGTAKIEISCIRRNVKTEVTITVTKSNQNAASKEERDKLDGEIKKLEAAYQDLSMYTADSANAFRSALEAAKKVLSDANATKTDVAQALTNLEKAKTGLKQNPPTTPKPPQNGYKFKVGALQYQVTKSKAKNGTVAVVKLVKKSSKKATIPATVKVKGFTFKVTKINSKVFQNNKKLEKVVIGSNVGTIGTKSFYGCKKLKTVVMGAKVSAIGTKSFYRCKNLRKITYKGTKAPKAGDKAFKGIHKNVKVYVPQKVTKKNLKKFKTTMKTAGKKIVIKKSKK